jgi:hypothetical protein
MDSTFTPLTELLVGLTCWPLSHVIFFLTSTEHASPLAPKPPWLGAAACPAPWLKRALAASAPHPHRHGRRAEPRPGGRRTPPCASMAPLLRCPAPTAMAPPLRCPALAVAPCPEPRPYAALLRPPTHRARPCPPHLPEHPRRPVALQDEGNDIYVGQAHPLDLSGPRQLASKGNMPTRVDPVPLDPPSKHGFIWVRPIPSHQNSQTKHTVRDQHRSIQLHRLYTNCQHSFKSKIYYSYPLQ